MNTFNKNKIFKASSLAVVAILLVCVALNFSGKEDSKELSQVNDPESQETDTSRDHEGDTFSIVAYDPNTGQVGGAACSCVGFNGGIDFLSDLITDGGGNIIGGMHSQAAYNATTQTFARNRMLAGDTPQQIINATVASDGGSASRQYGVVGFDGSGNLASAGFSGSSNGHFSNHIGGSDASGITYAIQGNILDNDNAQDFVNGQDLLDDMETAFINSNGTLAEKLMAAMQAAKRVGGDSRCEDTTNSGRTAFIQVLSPGESTPSIFYNTDAIPGQSTTSGVPNFTEPIDKLQDMYNDGEGVAFCNETVTEFPYAMDFETTSWNRFDLDNNPNDDDRSWMRDRLTTASGGTGPSDANQGTFYTYLEASGITGASDSAAIASPCFQIPNDIVSAQITFDYHMLGANIGTLALQANDQSGAGWVTIWSKTGEQGTSWFNDETVDLSAYLGETVKLRFNGSRDAGFASDMAIDDISVTLTEACDLTTTYNGTSWDNGLPTEGYKAIINADFNTSDSNIDACELTIANNATLTIDANTNIVVEGDIAVNTGSTIDVKHQGSVVQILETATVINNGAITVDIETLELKPRDFVLLGSPMTGDTREDTWSGVFRVFNHDTNLFVPNSDVATEFPLAENFADDNFNNYSQHTGVINPGEGFLVRPRPFNATGNEVFASTFSAGTLNTGNIDFDVIYNGSRNASYNLLANPYASAIDARTFIEENDMVDAVYIWEHVQNPNADFPGANTVNYSMEDISVFNLMGSTSATGSVQPNNGFLSTGQGFGIKATNDGATATFTNAMRTTANNNTLRTIDANRDRLWIEITNETYDLSSNTLIGFTENATKRLDTGYDANRLATTLSVYSHLENGDQELGIQGREAFNQEIQIPLGFTTQVDEEATYTISIKDLEGSNLNAATVYLVDVLENKVINLSQEEYSFKATYGNYSNRFIVQFTNRNILNNETFALENIVMHPNPATSFITIESPKSAIEKITVYDIQGKRLNETATDNVLEYQLNIAAIPSGVYLVTIQTAQGTINKRLIKK